MMHSNEDTLTNLRLVGGIKKHEYIQTDSNGDILSYLEHNFINCVSSAIYGENWVSTLKCLRKLYVEELPKLLDELFENESKKELNKVGSLLEKSIGGLENLKAVYQGTDSIAHIDTIVDDFAKNQLEAVCDFLKVKYPVESKKSGLPGSNPDGSDFVNLQPLKLKREESHVEIKTQEL
jgi:hypothetical protein